MLHTVSRWLFHERKNAVECALLLNRASAGTGFADAVMTVLDRHLGVDHFSVFLKSPAHAAAAQLLAAGDRQRDGLSMAIAKTYAARHCQWDQVPNEQLDAKLADGLIVWTRRAAEVRNPCYRLECYERPGIAERLTVGYAHCGAWRLLHLYRLRKSPSFDEQDVAQALRAAACILPALPSRGDIAAPITHTGQRLTRIRDRLRRLPVRLSEREVEVCARALLGMTVGGTALDLGVARTSIATYRKRAYQKLNISSHTELYALML